MLKKTIFSNKANVNLPKNKYNDVGIYISNGNKYSFNGRYRFNEYVYEVVSDFEEYKRLSKAVYIPPIPNLIVSSTADKITITSRNPVINNIIKELNSDVIFYDNNNLNVKCNYFIGYSDSTPDIFAVDYLFNYKVKKSSHFIFYDFYPFLSDCKSVLDIVDVFSGTYNKSNVQVSNMSINIYDIDLNSFDKDKWIKYLYWISSNLGSTEFINNKLFNASNYVNYTNVKDFFTTEIFKETV